MLTALHPPMEGLALLTAPDPVVGKVEVGPDYHVGATDWGRVMATGSDNSKLPTTLADPAGVVPMLAALGPAEGIPMLTAPDPVAGSVEVGRLSAPTSTEDD